MTSFGLLLPHFGENAHGPLIIAGARCAEAYEFDSVWVRDHLLYRPHGLESQDRQFLDALTTLSVVGASTSRVTLGTAALIPFRHPVHTALIASTMTQFFGPRLILGFGSGNDDAEFAAVGLDAIPRVAMVEAHVKILRSLWEGKITEWHGDGLDFSGVDLQPRPIGGQIPMFYCGSSPKGARIAVQPEFDGWMPGRIPLATLRTRVTYIREECERKGRDRAVAIGTVPIISIARNQREALEQVNVSDLLATADRNCFWVKPTSGRFERPEDLAGMLVYGSPEEVTAQCRDLLEAGVEHLVFDFRMAFDRWLEQVEVVGRQILPALRRVSDDKRSQSIGASGL